MRSFITPVIVAMVALMLLVSIGNCQKIAPSHTVASYDSCLSLFEKCKLQDIVVGGDRVAAIYYEHEFDSTWIFPNPLIISSDYLKIDFDRNIKTPKMEVILIGLREIMGMWQPILGAKLTFKDHEQAKGYLPNTILDSIGTTD